VRARTVSLKSSLGKAVGDLLRLPTELLYAQGVSPARQASQNAGAVSIRATRNLADLDSETNPVCDRPAFVSTVHIDRP
jgi:hypothetical protein